MFITEGLVNFALFRTNHMMSLKNRVAKSKIPDQEPGMIPKLGKWHAKYQESIHKEKK